MLLSLWRQGFKIIHMMHLRSKKMIYAVCALVSCLGIALGLYTDNTFLVVRDVSVEIPKSKLHLDLQNKVHHRLQKKLQSFRGQNILAVPLSRIRQHILSDVWVDSVVIERHLPDQLHISLELKSVVFVFLNSRSQFLPISTQGQVLNPISPEIAPDVPLVRNSNILKNPELLKKIISLYLQLPQEGYLSQQTVSEVDWSESEGLIVENASVDGGRIVLGKEGVRKKSARVANVLKYLESQNQKWRVIDASFSKKVLVRLRKHS